MSKEKIAYPMDLGNPASVVRYAPTSGVFGSDKYIGRQDDFESRVLAQWYLRPNNFYACETHQHISVAGDLYGLYLDIRAKAHLLNNTALAAILLVMGRTGSVSEADKVLKAKIAGAT